MKTTIPATRLVMTMMLLVFSTRVFAETEKPPGEAAIAYKLTDAVIVRPLGIGATLVGGALYLVTWPISAATGNKKDMYNTLVRTPAKLAFHQRRAEAETPLVQKEVVATKMTARK